MSIADFLKKLDREVKTLDESEIGPLELQNQINLNEKIAEAAKAYQQAQSQHPVLGALKGGLTNGQLPPTKPGNVIPIARGQPYTPNNLHIIPYEIHESLKRIQNENEKLFVLVKDMLDALEMIANNTETDDPNYWLRRGLIEGYLIRIGELVNEKESFNNSNNNQEQSTSSKT